MKIMLALPLILLAACGQSEDDIAVVKQEVVIEQPGPQAEQVVEAPPLTVIDTPEPAPPAAIADVPLDYILGKVDPANDPNFSRIPARYLGGPRAFGHKDAVAALVKMGDAAAADGVQLRAVSAFRSFNDQKRIWEDKWTGRTKVEGGSLPSTVPDPKQRALKILEYSSMPATSRHHWGTDFDLNSLNNSYFASGQGKKTYDWLVAHAAEYGFCQPYSKKGSDRPNGHEEEKWHWSYLPVAGAYLARYRAVAGYDHITGFQGSEAAKDIDVITHYVEGINAACKR